MADLGGLCMSVYVGFAQTYVLQYSNLRMVRAGGWGGGAACITSSYHPFLVCSVTGIVTPVKNGT